MEINFLQGKTISLHSIASEVKGHTELRTTPKRSDHAIETLLARSGQINSCVDALALSIPAHSEAALHPAAFPALPPFPSVGEFTRHPEKIAELRIDCRSNVVTPGQHQRHGGDDDAPFEL